MQLMLITEPPLSPEKGHGQLLCKSMKGRQPQGKDVFISCLLSLDTWMIGNIKIAFLKSTASRICSQTLFAGNTTLDTRRFVLLRVRMPRLPISTYL